MGEPILEESPAVCILKRDDELGAERVGRLEGKLNGGKHCEFCLRKVVHMVLFGSTALWRQLAALG